MAKKPTEYRTSQIELNEDQEAAYQLARAQKTFFLFYGGGGSGKSYLILYIILLRAMMSPRSRHIIFRFTLDSCRRTIFDKTLREVFEASYPGYINECKVSESEMTVELPNGSMLFFNGLNDETRMQKVLGDEYNTIWLNECNEFNYNHVSILIGRLRAKATTLDGKVLKNKVFADCNPASKRSWEYQTFIKGLNPIDGNILGDLDDWAHMKLRPAANMKNLDATVMARQAATMSAADRKRYVEGDWANDNQGGLFKDGDIAAGRIPVPDQASTDTKLDAIKVQGFELTRIGISVDPAASNNDGSDEHGITVSAVSRDMHGFVLEDLSSKGSPEQIARKAIQAFDDYNADFIIIEKNNGGDWLPAVFYGIRPNIPIKLVHASKGKLTRAEPVSALYERHRVHHVGSFPMLETQMTEYGAKGAKDKSPDRMDSMVWGITELCDINGDRTDRRVTSIKAKGVWGG